MDGTSIFGMKTFHQTIIRFFVFPLKNQSEMLMHRYNNACAAILYRQYAHRTKLSTDLYELAKNIF